MLGSIKAALASIATSIKSSITPIVAATTATVITGGCIYYYTIKDGIYEKREDNVRYVLEEYISQIALESIVDNGHGGYAYTTNLDKMTEEILTRLLEADSNITEYTGKDNAEEVVRSLIKAELITQYPDLRKASEIASDKEVPENEVQGGIKIVRGKSDVDTSKENFEDIQDYEIKEEQVLTYVPYKKFDDMRRKGDSTIKKHFSLKPSSLSSSLTGNFVVKTDDANASPVLTKEQIEQAINANYTDDTVKSNLLSALDSFIKMQDEYKVNAVFAIAVTQAESSCGTNWGEIDSSTYNWMKVKPESTELVQYTSFADATEKFGELISSSTYFGANKYSVTDIASTYRDATWGNTVNEYIAKIYNSIGIKIETISNVNTTQTNTNNSVDIVVAGWTEETTTVTTVEYIPKDDGSGDEKNTPKPTKNTVSTYNEVSINYQSMLSKYSMPAGFLWSLMVMGENVDFVLDVANLAINETNIVIEAQDNKITTVNENVKKYTYTKDVTKTATAGDGTTETTTTQLIAQKESSITTRVETTQSNTNLKLSYAETWVAIYNANYKNTVTEEEKFDEDWEEAEDVVWNETENIDMGKTDEKAENPEDDDTYDDLKDFIIDKIDVEKCKQNLIKRIGQLTNKDPLYYLFETDTDSSLTELCANYIYIYIKGSFTEKLIDNYVIKDDISDKIDNFWSNRTEDVKKIFTDNKIEDDDLSDKLYEMLQKLSTDMSTLAKAEMEVEQSKISNKNANNIQTTNSNSYSSAGTNVKEREDIDKEHNFVEYFNNSGRAKEYILETPSWLYEMLESQEKTANMIDLFKYLLYKSTNEDYGVRTFDFSIVNTTMGNMNSVSSGSGFWWPIGSSTTETINGKLFAKGEPPNTVITSGVGPRWGRNHGGIDIAKGSVVPGPYIIAADSGIVTSVTDGKGKHPDNGNGAGSGYGNLVIIDHGNGYETYYAHLCQGSIVVNKGDRVEKGQVLGQMGNSGRSTGVHLHFEVRLNGTKLDPEEYVDPKNPRPSRTGIMEFIATFEGGTQYYNAATGEYTIFHNPLDGNLELTGGVAVGSKASGVNSRIKKMINRNDLQEGSKISEQEYNTIFTDTYNGKVQTVNKVVAELGITLNQNQIDAVISFCYNAANAEASTRKALTGYKNKGEAGYWEYIHDFTHSDGKALEGLVRRRAEEFEMFTTGDYVPSGYGEAVIKHRQYNLKYGLPEYSGET